MLIRNSCLAITILAYISTAAAGVITLPMTGLVIPEHQNPASLTKRYLHKRSTASTSSLSSALHDIMYTVALGIGTPPQIFNLAIDTGSPVTWVLNKTCAGAGCDTIFNKFNCASSPTCQMSPSSGKLNVSYVSGDSVVGNYVHDIFNLGGLSFQSLAGVVDYYSANLPPTVDDRNVPLDAPFLNTLKDTNALTEPVIGIWLATTNTDVNNTAPSVPGGELTFGGIDPSRFVGNITYINCDPISPWTIPLDSVSVSGKTYLTTSALVTIDTGTSAMLVPEAISDAINSGIPGSIKMAAEQDGASWIIPCTGTTTVSFTFGTFTVNIPYSSLTLRNVKFQSQNTGKIYCASAVMFPTGRAPMKEWLLGDSLLKNVYSVYDFGTNAATGGRIGFAQLSGAAFSNSINRSAGNIQNDDAINLGNGYNGGQTNDALLNKLSISRVFQALAVIIGIVLFTL
ncbi:hypothetical protein BGZ46_002138 [Entomortierella lignicola]|nr:hypothetical protein BGZ46_002138 [Entomortierella lignicola]